MEHDIDSIIDKPSDYKKCNECGSVNWYENDVCRNCGCESFKQLTKSGTEEFKKIFGTSHVQV